MLLDGIAHEQRGSRDERRVDAHPLTGDLAVNVESEIVLLSATVPTQQDTVLRPICRE